MEWITGMDYWNESLYLNIPLPAYFHILSILHVSIDKNLIQFSCIYLMKLAIYHEPR